MGLLGLVGKEEIEKLRLEQYAMLDKYNKKLGQYKITLEQCQEQLRNDKQMYERLNELVQAYENESHDRNFEGVQIALDLKFLKEQSDQIQDLLTHTQEGKLTQIKETLQENEQMQKEIVVSQTKLNETMTQVEQIVKTTKKLNRRSIWFHLIEICVIVVLFLILFEVIVI